MLDLQVIPPKRRAQGLRDTSKVLRQLSDAPSVLSYTSLPTSSGRPASVTSEHFGDAANTLRLSHEIHPNADRIVADRIQLEHVLLNLIRNASEAIQARPDGYILITACRSGDMSQICVQDNGPGVSAEARSQLFSPFRTCKSEGLGIGLSICRAIVEEHGGRIWLADGREGARFCLTMPIPEKG